MTIKDLDSSRPSKMPQLDQESTKSNSIISTDFETALSKAGIGKFNFLLLLIAIPASATSPFVTGAMSFVIPVAATDLGLTQMTKAMLQSAPYIGLISSAFLWGVMSDYFGRQRLLAAGFLLDFAMNTACGLIRNVPSMVVFKLLSGIMVCGPSSIYLAYTSELFAEKVRDIAVLSTSIFSAILLIGQVGLALLFSSSEPPDWLPLKSWQLFILVSGIPALLSGIGYSFCVESPKFLLGKGKAEKALDICKIIYTINTNQPADTYPVKEIYKPRENEDTPKISIFKKIFASTSIFKPPYIYRLAMVFIMQSSIASGLNMIRLWLPEILTVMQNVDPQIANHSSTLCSLLAAGHENQGSTNQTIPRNYVYYSMMVVTAGSLVAQIVFVIIVKYVGKKSIIMASTSIAMICSITIPNINGEYVFIPAAIQVSVLGTAFFSLISLVVEIFPTQVRATSVAMTMMIGRVAILAGNFLIANVIDSYCEYIFYSMAALSFCIFVICAFLDTTPFPDSSQEESKIQE